MTGLIPRLSVALVSLFALASLGSLAGCYKNQTTGRSQLGGGLTHNEEVSLGISEGPKLTQEFGGEVQNPNLRAYVNEVGQRLKDQTTLAADGSTISEWGDAPPGPQRTWVFTLLDSDVVNAFAIPGERVFMSRGLADKLTSEAQLAGVLGHEIGHVMARHTAERMGQSQYVGIGAAIAGAIAGAAIKDPTLGQAVPGLVNASGQVTLLKFSREQESEADKLGMRYMSGAGYNPRGQLEVMQVLDRESGGGGSPEFLATHPLPKTRIQDVQNLLNTTYAHTQNGPQKGQFQDYADRYRERYLSVRAQEPIKPAPAKGQATPGTDVKSGLNNSKKRSEVPMDEHGRPRMLAAFVYDEPSTWCAHCAEFAREGQFVR